MRFNSPKIYLLVLIFVVLLSSFAFSYPPLPMEIYGSAKSFNTPVSPGLKIQAIDSTGNVCGEFTVINYGLFGTMSCMGEDTVSSIPGASSGEQIRFRVGNFPASVLFNTSVEGIGNLYWGSGVFQEVILVAPPLVCGDGFCDSYENCNTCPEDCGVCPAPPTPPDPQPSQPSFPDFGPEVPPIGPEIPEEEEIVEECLESWSCGDWGPCFLEGLQFRDCVDLNQCGTDEEKPETEKSCIFDEEEFIPPDSVERPRVEEPAVIEKCDDRLPFFSVESLFFLVLFAIILLTPLFFLKAEKNTIKRKKLEETEELLSIYQAEHKVHSFLIIVSVLSVIVYFYHYFFFLCKDVYYNNLWLLFAFVLVSPLIINLFLALLKYSERDKLLKINLLNNTHYKHLMFLSKLYKEELARSEAEITNQIYALNSKEEFGKLLLNVKEIKRIYDDLLKLYDLYVHGKDSLKIEKDLLNQIIVLDKNADFASAVQKYPGLSLLKNNISLLFKAYESKQELDARIRVFEESLKHPEKEDELSKNQSLDSVKADVEVKSEGEIKGDNEGNKEENKDDDKDKAKDKDGEAKSS